MTQKTALITGITGQDGAYLAQLLLNKGYKVCGTYRRSSSPNFWRLHELGVKAKVNLTCMELSDQSSIQGVMQQVKPDEVYNLAAQSFVQTSFQQPIYAGELDGISVTRMLDAVRFFRPEARFYQASSSEMYGKVQEIPQSEATPFYPRSPYAVAKLYGHWITVNYRESYDMFACSGILFNHESPLRGLEFVTRKITSGLAAVKCGKAGPLELGNMNAKRDWGFAGDYVEGMWRMLQQATPDDYVLATGVTTTVRDFATMVAKALDVELEWTGEGEAERAVNRADGKVWIQVNKEFYRPAEVDLLIGTPAKAKQNLGWQPKVALAELVAMMTKADYDRQQRGVTF